MRLELVSSGGMFSMTDIVMSYAHLVRSNPLNFINSDISCLAWRASTSVALPESKSSTLIHVLGYYLHCFGIYILVIFGMYTVAIDKNGEDVSPNVTLVIQ